MTQKLPAAALWDLDGTLVDSEPLWRIAEEEMLAEFGLSLPDSLAEQLVGSSLWRAADLFRDLGVDLPADVIISRWVERVQQLYTERGPVWR
ncbi:MAG: HAD family phosphatase, partial [Microbacteriaceae bacterium]|nr:HAD family phosphatase [Microbacteriaceae bacterium]